MNIIEVENVTKKFGHYKALDDLSLSIARGRIFGLLGPNGAGKTTLIRLLTCINTPDSGVIRFLGHELTPADVSNIGYLPEERGLYKKMKVSEQAVYMARLRGMSKRDATESLQRWFHKLGIESWWNRRVEDLSKGMQQKVQFIVTVVHNPDFLIFDEPFSGFDPINAEQLKSEILELKENGATIILSTHNMASVEEICDDIALINKGKVIIKGAVNEVRRTFRQNRFHITFEGQPEVGSLPEWMQLIDRSTDSQTTTLQLQLDDNHHANDLLQHFISCQSILSFGEVLPSMNDIFIRTIQAQNENH